MAADLEDVEKYLNVLLKKLVRIRQGLGQYLKLWFEKDS
jgi:hypothetical protein